MRRHALIPTLAMCMAGGLLSWASAEPKGPAAGSQPELSVSVEFSKNEKGEPILTCWIDNTGNNATAVGAMTIGWDLYHANGEGFGGGNLDPIHLRSPRTYTFLEPTPKMLRDGDVVMNFSRCATQFAFEETGLKRDSGAAIDFEVRFSALAVDPATKTINAQRVVFVGRGTAADLWKGSVRLLPQRAGGNEKQGSPAGKRE